MIVRAIDINGDWLFGKGQNDYRTNNDAIAQNIKTRLSSFLGDCFFDTTSGIDWFNLLGGKDQLVLNLAINAVILNTQDVTGVLQLFSNLSDARVFFVQYKVQTTYSQLSATYQYDLNGLA